MLKKLSATLFALALISLTTPSLVKAAASTDQLIVRFKSELTPVEQANLLNQHGLIFKKKISNLDLQVLKLKPGKNLDDAMVKLKNSVGVISVEADDLVEPIGKPNRALKSLIPNDPSYSKQWHLPKIMAPNAWYLATAPKVVLGICDTGVQADHPDLNNILMTRYGFNTADNTTNWSPITNHGTKVAGTIASATNNNLGVAGVAWGALIMPVRISNLADGSAYVSDAAECITYLANNGAKAANLSYRMASYSAIETAAQYGNSHNMITVVSAGNDATNPGWTDFPSFLAVSATDKNDQLASFSSYGTYVDLAAPGVSIYTTDINSSYASVNGTSFSAPIVVGTIGLIYGAKPTLTVAQATSILLNSTDDIGSVGEDVYFGRGRVNTYKAVTKALATP